MKKSELRSIFRAKRQELDRETIEQFDQKITERFFSKIDLAGVSCLSTYIGLSSLNEFDTQKLIKKIKEKSSSSSFAIPKVIENNQMLHYRLEEKTKLVPNRFGILEPAGGDIVEPGEIDLVIVPLLAFDRRLERVGYGGGFYDRFLASCRRDCQKLGISYFEPVEIITDTEATDISLDAVITPDAIFR